MFARLTSQLEKVGITSSSSSPAAADKDGEKQDAAPATPANHRPIRPMDPAVQEALTGAGVPVVSCMDCPAPCDPDHPTADASDIFDAKLLSAWRRQDIDYDEVMFPSNSPFLRHVMISTGKRDWAKDIASVRGSLAQLFEGWAGEVAVPPSAPPPAPAPENDAPTLPKGCWRTTPGAQDRPTRLVIGNSSHVSSSSRPTGQSVLLFPDYVMVQDVPDATDDGGDGADEDPKAIAKSAFDAFISPASPGTDSGGGEADAAAARKAAQAGTTRYVLPYRAVIALCSHKKRDARCGISAPMLAEVFRRHAEAAGWDVDERGDEVGHHGGGGASSAGENVAGEVQWSEDGTVRNRGWGYIHDAPESPFSAAHQSAVWRRQLCGGSPSSSSSTSSSESGAGSGSGSGASAPSPPPPSLLILHTSHIGKHKYAGNVLLYFPNGSGVWYGRVDPYEGAARVWEQTVRRGRVIGEYLRVGVNLWRGGGGRSGAEDEDGAAGGEAQGRIDGGEGEAGERLSGSKAQLEAAAAARGDLGILAW